MIYTTSGKLLRRFLMSGCCSRCDGEVLASGRRCGIHKHVCEPISIISRDRVEIDLPTGVKRNVFEACLDAAMNWDTYENHRTGALILLHGSGGNTHFTIMSEDTNSYWTKQTIVDSHGKLNTSIEGRLRQLFFHDGGCLVGGDNGSFLAATAQFFALPGNYFVDGHGTKHNTALNVTHHSDAVAIVRSEDGSVTIFSAPHTKRGEAIRLYRSGNAEGNSRTDISRASTSFENEVRAIKRQIHLLACGLAVCGLFACFRRHRL